MAQQTDTNPSKRVRVFISVVAINILIILAYQMLSPVLIIAKRSLYFWNDTTAAVNRNPEVQSRVSSSTSFLLINDHSASMLEKLEECDVPSLSPFEKNIENLINPIARRNCIQLATGIDERLFEVKRGTRVLQKLSESYNYSGCCYTPFYRESDHMNIHMVDPTCFPISEDKLEVTLPVEHEFIEVACPDGKKDGFAIVAEKPAVEKRLERLDQDKSDEMMRNGDRLNVIVFGIDATSRMNFLRMMPNSHSFLTQNLSAVIMKKYTKMAQNTLPNTVPMLTGSTLQYLKSTCIKDVEDTNSVHVDDCDFIWKKYSSEGYRTSFAEDYLCYSNFNMYWPYAFKKPPTDYYLRTFVSRLQLTQNKLNDECLGTRLSFKILLDNVENIAVAFKNYKPYFQYTWATRIAHNDFNGLALGDEILLDSLKFLSSNGLLNNTAFFIISDHGSRLGEITETKQGRIEDRLPVHYIVLPPWFKTKYPISWRNLRSNEDKLTSAFDLHKTLLQFMDLRKLKEIETPANLNPIKNSTSEFHPDMVQPKRRRNYLSLFQPIPAKRSCYSAGIPMQWCMCHKKNSVYVNSPDVITASEFAKDSINSAIQSERSCAQWKVHTILEAYGPANLNKLNDGLILNVVFTTLPGNAVFDATVYRRTANDSWVLTENPGRMDKYEEQSYCVQQNLKQYCFCNK